MKKSLTGKLVGTKALSEYVDNYQSRASENDVPDETPDSINCNALA